MAEEWLYSIMPENRANREKWLPTIQQAEQAHGLPATLLDRLLWRESRYRTDIITGALKSSAGAIGIAQFMPATAKEYGINPLDPAQAIPAAARYLANSYRVLGSWKWAVASYNAGIGRVQQVLKGERELPTETQTYIAEIVTPLNLA